MDAAEIAETLWRWLNVAKDWAPLGVLVVAVVALLVGRLTRRKQQSQASESRALEDEKSRATLLQTRVDELSDEVRKLENLSPDLLLERVRRRLEVMEQEYQLEVDARDTAEGSLAQELDARTKVETELLAKSGEIDRLTTELGSLETKLLQVESALAGLQAEQAASKMDKEELSKQLAEKRQQQTELERKLQVAFATLNAATARDVNWLTLVRTRLMPKQPGRVPFHNAAEIAIRGYHPGQSQKPPMLKIVTWSKLPYNEDGLHRGYHAGLVFTGDNFHPGIVWAYRRAPGDKVHWREPNIYFGGYLEVAGGGEEPEAPLSWRGMEWAVRNPDGRVSEWVHFTYVFDDDALMAELDSFEKQGRALMSADKPADASEPLRKAWLYSSRLLGDDDARSREIRELREQALDEAAKAKLRFRVGDVVKVVSGEHTGSVATIESVGLRSLKAYGLGKGADAQHRFVADDEVEPTLGSSAGA